jgi:hypothetical protein
MGLTADAIYDLREAHRRGEPNAAGYLKQLGATP